MIPTKPQSAPLNQLSHKYSELSQYDSLTIFDNSSYITPILESVLDTAHFMGCISYARCFESLLHRAQIFSWKTGRLPSQYSSI